MKHNTLFSLIRPVFRIRFNPTSHPLNIAARSMLTSSTELNELLHVLPEF
jgi:hypothetical protein